MLIFCLAFLGLCSCALLLSGSHTGRQADTTDCGWYGEGQAYVDLNGNRVRDRDEPPLEDVQFFMDDVKNGNKAVGNSKITSDNNGVAPLAVSLPGCPDAAFEVYAVPPPGYVPSTADRLAEEDVQNNMFVFGFKPSAP